MRTTKVCHLTTVHPAFDTRIFQKECKTLCKSSYDVTLIAQNEKDEIVDNVRIIALSREKNRIHRMLVLTLKAFWLSLKQRADIYHFHDAELIPVGIFLKLLGKKVIYDVHEDNSKTVLTKSYLPIRLRKLISILITIIEKNAARFFDYIIVAGDDIAKNVFSTFGHNLISLRNMPPLEFVNACYNDGEKMDWIIYTGVLTRERGIKEIVEAMKYVTNKNAKLLLVGPFRSPEFEKEVRILANEKVSFEGSVPFKDVPNFIKNAKIGLICFHPFPNMFGALSGRNNKLYEYMAGGLAIVASNFVEWITVIEGDKLGITVNPKDPKDIASAIDYLLNNPEILKKMGQNGLKAVHDKCNWDIEKDKLLQVYSKLQNGQIN